MTITAFQALACPLDGKPLQIHGRAWCCEDGHSFDIARQGYVHLLPVQNKRSREPGDSKAMVAARRQFLNAGHYQPVADAVNRTVLADCPPESTISCLDAGCGEGWYLRQLAEALGEDQSLAVLGLDISKWAVLAAARQTPEACWVVGSNANLPVLPETLDWVFCIFGFPVYGEFARVLKPGGRLLRVDPGPDHLRELREIIYPALKPEREEEAQVPAGFEPVATDEVRYLLNLNSQTQIADLLAMTPHLYRADAAGRARAEALMSLTVTVDVRLTTLGKRISV